MKIDPNFNLRNFERHNFNGGTLFILWDKFCPNVTLEPSFLNLGGDGFETFLLKIPHPDRLWKGMILLMRESKSYYRYVAQNGDTVTHGAFKSLKQVTTFCEEFFQ